MKIVLFGSSGQLGWEFQRSLMPLGEICPADRKNLDLRDTGALHDYLYEKRPQLIINASAYTDVDLAEQEPEIAFQVNERAPRSIAEIAKSIKAAFFHFSTDYVFDGKLGRPYTEMDPTFPLNTYGRSKLAGEKAIQEAGGNCLIFRTSWVYSLRGNSFVNKVLRWMKAQKTLQIVDDQISNPTWARSLAGVITDLIERNKDDIYEFAGQNSGLYHVAGRGFASRYEWAKLIAILDPQYNKQLVQSIHPAQTKDFPTAATRPLFTALDCSLFEARFGLRLPDWKLSLKSALEEESSPF